MKLEYIIYLWAAALIGTPALLVIGIYTGYWLWLKWLAYKFNKQCMDSIAPAAGSRIR